MASTIESFSEEISRLSIQERSDALEDLHGVSSKIQETEELIEAKSNEINVLLSSLGGMGKDSMAYKKAVELSPEYVDKMKVSFLRVNRYNVQNAASQMILFFNRKLELFGDETIVKDLTMNDLTEEEQDYLRSGIVQLLPERDRGGRAILMVHGGAQVLCPSTKGVMRVSFYFVMATLQDTETQMSGTVLLYYGIDQNNLVPGRTMEFSKNWLALPWRCVACHYCRREKVLFAESLQVLCKSLHSSSLGRFRFHSGTPMETFYNLMTFGIPRDAIPFDDSGNIRTLSHHHMILQTLKAREEAKPLVVKLDTLLVEAQEDHDDSDNVLETSSPRDTILIPRPMDVIMGRGRHPKSRPGSLRLHNLLIEYKEKYETAGKAEKTAISKHILQQMKDSGSRFLSTTPSSEYVECDDSTAREKISHGFRNLRLKKPSSAPAGDDKKTQKRGRE